MVISIRLVLICFCTLLVPLPSAAATFAMSTVTAAVPRGAAGHDAGVSVRNGRYIRLAASGGIALGFGACAKSVGPRGCAAAMSFSRTLASEPAGTLLAAFADKAGALVTSWAAVGDFATMAIPARAERLLFRINGAQPHAAGRFRVATDVIGGAAAATAAADASSPVHRLAVGRQVLGTNNFTRAEAAHLLRRFGFGASPADTSTVYGGRGAGPYLASQLSPATIDDSALQYYMEPFPTYTGDGSIDYKIDNEISARIVQREIATQRQLLEKITLFWLEHFAVSEDKVNDPGAMGHYEDTIRADALGNFATLVTDVTKEPAMLIWLDNNFNDGSDPQYDPPNENFGRELMQLYTVGPNELNADGSTVVDANQNPVPTYGEPDVKAIALALTGFEVHGAPQPVPTGVDPRTFDTVSFATAAHAHGPFTIIGQQIIDPGNSTIADAVVRMLANQPSTAPFEVKELLQRVATDDPSPAFVSRISAVWTANLNDPNQIGKVVNAIANDPEFYADQNGLVKEPIEYAVDAVRDLGAATDSALDNYPTAFDTLRNDLEETQQDLFHPSTVFSFYRPGDKESMLSNSEMLARWSEAVDISNTSSLSPSCTSNCSNFFIGLAALKGLPPARIADTLCDDLVAGGSPELRQIVQSYLLANPTNITGAVWIVLTSPEYEVN